MTENNGMLVSPPGATRAWMRMSLGGYRPVFQETIQQLSDQNVIERIWKHDHTVWNPAPDEILNRLGWLHLPELMQPRLPEINQLLSELNHEGFEEAVVLGMGGSSLAPDLFSRMFAASSRSLKLLVLDSTDPGAILTIERHLNPLKTVFIVSTKSGGTEETLSFLKYFYQQTLQVLGNDVTGDHFIAITDPGSKLENLAHSLRFRKTFLNDPALGGRYSALSHFGLVPATLAGIDSSLLLDRASEIGKLCSAQIPIEQNPAALLGAALGSLATIGRDKLTFVNPPVLDSFADWAEQLIAESTGKGGKGILPIVGENLDRPDLYGNDRIFVHIYPEQQLVQSSEPVEEKLSALEEAGHPVIHIALADRYDIGGQFLLWEIATAVTGFILQLNPFDQPDVEAAKVRARQMVAEYKTTGALPAQVPILETAEFGVYGAEAASSVSDALRSFLQKAHTGDYAAVLAYLQPGQATSSALRRLQSTLMAKTHCAVTIGYGPRFLHSTGQLHKGDRGNGLFILLTDSPEIDLEIPDEAETSGSSITFGVLKLAQALGDQMALADSSRRILRLHLKSDPVSSIEQLEREIQAL